MHDLWNVPSGLHVLSNVIECAVEYFWRRLPEPVREAVFAGGALMSYLRKFPGTSRPPAVRSRETSARLPNRTRPN